MIRKLLLGTWHQLTDAPKGDAGLGENPRFIYLLEHPHAYARRVAK
jgi:hypothetical protein